MRAVTMQARASTRAMTGSGAGSSSRGQKQCAFTAPGADRLKRAERTRAMRPQRRRHRGEGTRVEALAVIRLLKFDPDRVSVSFAEDTCRRIAEPDRTRRYTLTHNDLTQHLTLSVATDFNPDGQADVWYTRLLRDEVLAEWCDDGLHVHCNVTVAGHWWIAWAKQLRSLVFRQKLPLVLDTLRFAEQDLLNTAPSLANAPVFVHFHEGPCGTADSTRFNNSLEEGVREYWGLFSNAGTREGFDQTRSYDEELERSGGHEAFSLERDLWTPESVSRKMLDSSGSGSGSGSFDEREGRGGGGGGGGVDARVGAAARSFAKSPGLSARDGPPDDVVVSSR